MNFYISFSGRGLVPLFKALLCLLLQAQEWRCLAQHSRERGLEECCPLSLAPRKAPHQIPNLESHKGSWKLGQNDQTIAS